MFLLDTNIVSELRKPEGKINKGLLEWFSVNADQSFYLSVITLYEIERGIHLLERRDELQGRRLRNWFEHQVKAGFRDRILGIDVHAAAQAAAAQVPNPRPFADCLIGATALVNGLTLVTRNDKDFEWMNHIRSAAVVNPFN